MSTENLSNEEALRKLKELVDKIDIGMVCTFGTEDDYPHAVPMSRQEIDEEGNIWYLFSSNSQTHTNLKNNNRVSVLFSHVSDYNFLSVNGTAEISTDQERIDKYWDRFVEAWFEKGREDPNIRLLHVKVEEAHYWDNKTNKLATAVKLLTSAVTGKKLDIGRQGDLDV